MFVTWKCIIQDRPNGPFQQDVTLLTSFLAKSYLISLWHKALFLEAVLMIALRGPNSHLANGNVIIWLKVYFSLPEN